MNTSTLDHSLRRILVVMLPLVLTGFLCHPARANTYSWAGPTSDNLWTTPSNWGGSVPSSGDDAVFPSLSMIESVDLSGSQQINSVQFNSTSPNTYLLYDGTLYVSSFIDQAGSADGTFDCAVSFGGTLTLSGAGSGNVYLQGGLSGSPTIMMTGGNYWWAGANGFAPSSLTVNGGYLHLIGTNTISFGLVTLQSGGTMCVQGFFPSTVSAGSWNVNSGGTLKVSGPIGGPVYVSGGTFAPGCSPGSAYVQGNLSFDVNSTAQYELATPNTVANGNDYTSVNGDLSLAGTIQVVALSGFGTGTYRLFDCSGNIFNSGVQLGQMPDGFGGQLDFSTPGQVNLIVTNAGTLSYGLPISAGLSLIANQLDHGSNSVADIFSGVPDGSMIAKYDNGSGNWFLSTYNAASNTWSDPDVTLSPGEGAFFQSPTNFTLTFTGTPHVPVLPVAIPTGATYLLSRQTNDTGTWTNIVGSPPPSGSKVYQWTGAGYQIYSYRSTGWSPSEPTAAVSEALWFSPPGGGPPPPIGQIYTRNVSSGLSLIANQIDHGSNTLNAVLPVVPDGSALYKYSNSSSGSGWTISYYSGAAGKWLNGDAITLNPGEGAFFQSPTNFTLTFTGTPHVPVLPVSIPPGATYLLSRQTNDVGTYTNIVGSPPPDGAIVDQWEGTNYVEFMADSGSPTGWDDMNFNPIAPPQAAVGEALWISLSGTGTLPVTPNSTNFHVLTPGPGPLCAGSPVTITWTGGLPTWNLTIVLVDVTTVTPYTIIAASTPNTGSYNWTLPPTLPPHVFTIFIQEVSAASWVYGPEFTVPGPCPTNNCVPPPSGLGLWLPFDETSGTTSANLYPGGNSGTQMNGPTVISGYVANSLSFNGANQFVTVPDYPAIDPAAGQNFSIDAWVMRASNAPNSLPSVIVDKRDPNSGVGYSLALSYGNLVFQMNDGSGYNNFRDSGFIPPDDQWHFIAVTVTRGQTNGGQFYVDGVATATFDTTLDPGSLASTAPFQVAASPIGGNRPWLGAIDEVEYFQRTLLTTEVQAIFNAGSAGKCKCIAAPANLGLWLPLDEVSGTTSVNLAPGGNNGAHIGAPVVNAGYVSNSLSFNGANQYVSVPNYGAINPGFGDFSVDAWVRRAANSPNSPPSIILDKRDPNTGIGYSLALSYGNLIFQIDDGSGYTNYRDTGTIPPDNKWHLVAVTVIRRQTNGGQFYIDGSPTSAFNPVAYPGNVTNSFPFNVAYSLLGGNVPWFGGIDEVEYFQRALAASEVLSIFNAQTHGKCKNGCGSGLTVVCPTNKVVECGSAWKFDAPSASDPGCSNVVITIESTVTNADSAHPCWQDITRTWAITGCCGTSNFCSQTVTVADRTPPSITCATNKTVQCGSTWTFDAPTAVDACDGSKISLTFVTVTNGVCPQLITRTWTATDACGNSNECSQTVTVVDNTPPTMTCASNKTVICGSLWSFDPPAVSDTCSGTNVNLTFMTVTNSLCPLTITRTWTATDSCGNYNQCSQTVTVEMCVPPPSGLVLWLPFDETSGTNTANLYVGGNNGTLIGPPSHNLGVYVDNSLCFSANAGVDEYVSVPDYTAIDPVAGQGFTLDAWVSRAVGGPNSPPCVVLDKRDVNTGNGYSLSVDYGHVILTLSGTSYTDATDVIPADGSWHFVAVTVSGGSSGTGEFYVDGHVPVSFTPSPATLATTAPFLVGESILDNHVNNQPWQGCIDEVEMFNRALGSNEVAAIFQAATLGKCKASPVTCSTNKTVLCGTAWSFDPPIITGCGSYTMAALTPVTNGVCPKFITETWVISNLCWGTTYQCSQEVTVIDSTPPLVICETNLLVVALNTNCELVIPLIKPPARDNCTPVNQLVYTQSPPAYTIVPGHSQLVTITVTDLCGNSSQCHVLVIGEDKTGPVITGPSSITVSNCMVPCVLNLITAVDNCCPPSSLHYSQSPPCNTPIGPGIGSVTVTVTDCNGNTTTKVIALNVSATESFLHLLYNSGDINPADVAPNLVAPGAVDSHYTLGLRPPGTLDTPGPNTLVAAAYPWDLTEIVPISKWLTPAYSGYAQLEPAGGYTNTLASFVLPAGSLPNTASISGRWANDNYGAIFLNGHPVLSGAIPSSVDGFRAWTYFTIAGAGLFNANPTPNTLTFVVTNTGLYTGLRVEFTNAVINCFTCAPPSVVWVSGSQSLPLGGTATFTVSAVGTPPLNIQWLHNGAPIVNGPHYPLGVSGPTLVIAPLTYADAGTYSVNIYNPCGGISSIPTRLTVTSGWPWPWSWWNVAQLATPLAATYGPNLVLAGTNSYALTAGTSDDFGLASPDGQSVNVLHVPAFAPDTTIQLPYTAPAGSNSVDSYTLLMDIYPPSSSSGAPYTLFANIDGDCPPHVICVNQLALEMDATNCLEVSGYAYGVPFDVVSAMPMALDAWSRIALVVDNPLYDGSSTDDASVALYINGAPVGFADIAMQGAPIGGLSIIPTNTPPTLMSAASGVTGEFYVSSIQFHAVAMSPEGVAGMGMPGTGPAPGGNSSISATPVLTATLSNGAVTISWQGSSYALQESTDLRDWVDSTESFTETQGSTGGVTTTVKPTPQAPAKFYRLVFRP